MQRSTYRASCKDQACMSDTTKRSPSNQDLPIPQGRIAQIKREVDDLRNVISILRANTERDVDGQQRPSAAPVLANMLAGLFGSQQVCAYRMAPDGAIVAASPALLRMLGYESLDDLRAKNPDGDEYDAA